MTNHTTASWLDSHRWFGEAPLTGELACADCGLTIDEFTRRFEALYRSVEAVRDQLANQHGAYAAFPMLPPDSIDTLNAALDAAFGA